MDLNGGLDCLKVLLDQGTEISGDLRSIFFLNFFSPFVFNVTSGANCLHDLII